MKNALQEEVIARCKLLCDDKVFTNLLAEYVNKAGAKVSEMRLQDLAVVLNDLVIPWEKREASSVLLHYSLNGELVPFALCVLKDSKPDLSTLVML